MKYNDFKKRKNLTFDTRDEEHKKAYEYVCTLNRDATRYIVNLINNNNNREKELIKIIESKDKEITRLNKENREMLQKILNKIENIKIVDEEINSKNDDIPDNIINFIKGFQI